MDNVGRTNSLQVSEQTFPMKNSKQYFVFLSGAPKTSLSMAEPPPALVERSK